MRDQAAVILLLLAVVLSGVTSYQISPSASSMIRHHHRIPSSSSSSSRQISMMAPSPSGAKLSKLPTRGKTYYDDVRKQSIDAVNQGIKQGLKQIEIEFPINPGRIDVSLGEFLDESRQWAREFLRPYTPKGQNLWVIFPDAKEANLAGNKWGGVNFRIMGIETAMKIPKDEPCELQIVITPGYNIEEFLNLEKVDRGVPMIIINGNLDRVKTGYYPRIFYPNLYNVKERYLKYFEPVFYLKPLPGGFIFRKFPEPWQQISEYYEADAKGKKQVSTSVVKTTNDRPVYNDVANLLKREGLRVMQEEREKEEARRQKALEEEKKKKKQQQQRR